MSTLQGLLVQLAMTKAVKTHVEALEAATKKAIKDEVGGRLTGAAAILPDGSEGLSVWITKPSGGSRGGEPYVVNEKAFTDWVKEHRPSAIVETVRGSDRESILKEIEKTGDVPDGIAFTEPKGPSGGGSVGSRQSDEQRDNVIRAWREGSIVLPAMLPTSETQEVES